MIANISPASSCCENTLNTIRYADRVKELKKGGKEPVSKEEFKAKELGLARKETNIQHIKINQQSLQPKGAAQFQRQ